MPDGRTSITPIVPVLVGDDWQAALLWKALYDAGVYMNVALYPAVQRGGALLRTSVMATHEREHLDRALDDLREGQGRGRERRAAALGGQHPPTPPCGNGYRSRYCIVRAMMSLRSCWPVMPSTP